MKLPFGSSLSGVSFKTKDRVFCIDQMVRNGKC